MCTNPISIRRVNGYKEGTYVLVPCGRCAECCKRRQNDWYVRLSEEFRQHRTALFVTLTYDDEHVPRVEKDGKVYLSVCKKDVQCFVKRFRKSLEPRKIRYFVCAEYGPKTFRPHYHCVIFGADSNDVPILRNAWKNGFVDASRVRTNGSLRYVAKYCSKPAVLRYELNAPVEKTFRLVSLGLGKSYIDRPGVMEFHHNDLQKHTYYWANGFKYGLPRYLKQKIYTHAELLEIQRLNERDKLKEFRFHFTHCDRLNGRKIYWSDPYQEQQIRENDFIENNHSDAQAIFHYNKFMSKSIF